MLERSFDIAFIADLALREKQIQQNYRPIIAVHKWFARRPGTLFRGLLLAEFLDRPLRETYYQANNLEGRTIADPFMGGGTPLIEANRLGCDIEGYDINPMAYWIVKQEIEHLDLHAYCQTAQRVRQQLENTIGRLYRTQCTVCGSSEAHVKYFLWVKTISCSNCGDPIDLFPGYLLASDVRHPRNVFICPACGQLTETEDRSALGNCHHCGARLASIGPARRGRCECARCTTSNTFPDRHKGPPRHRLFALEYHCPACRGRHEGRYFKVPDSNDLAAAQAAEKYAQLDARFVPDDAIPSGDETNRLHRWGYNRYHEMFNTRQLLGLELSARIITATDSERVRNALATNLSDLLRYQNMLCRYDTMALKSLDIFSVHGFPVGLVQCESNLLGIIDPTRGGACIGSGGWANIIEKFRKAKAYCDAPFEIRHRSGTKEVVAITGEWIGDQANGEQRRKNRRVALHCQDAAQVDPLPHSLDAVLTDPPYFGNVQYAELMDFCYVWLRRLIRTEPDAFAGLSTRHPQELTGNEDMGRGIDHFAQGVSAVMQKMAQGLKPGAPLAFTYHHNDITAYFPLAVAVLDAGLTCSATLPCPAEMGASIHISGTASSIIDTVFVCRSTGTIPRKWLVDSPAGVAALVNDDLAKLRAGNVKPTLGDKKCITYGHLVRLAIWHLRRGWDRNAGINQRLTAISSWVLGFGGWNEIARFLDEAQGVQPQVPLFAVGENIEEHGANYAEVPF